MLKRGLSVIINEFLLLVEYIIVYGNREVIFCERGIRIFEIMIRNILDINVIVMIKELLYFLIIVDVSYGIGKRSLVEFVILVGIFVGVNGVMVEVYENLDCVLFDGF